MKHWMPLFLVAALATSSAHAQDKSTSRPTSQPTSKPTSKRGKPGIKLDDCSGEYGAGLSKAKLPAPKLKELLENPQKFSGKTIRVTGKINDVCQKKGCWVMLRHGAKGMRVKFKDYAFFLPLNSKDETVTLEGVAKVVTISEAVAKHYAEESGDKEAAKKIKGPQKGLMFMASGAKIHKKKAAKSSK